ncbi:DinB family protein [Tengunoibacter tsumagoiensis]|uniref:DinB-like domain-containing protein n=1 Tax=Tengunoibacter tsumagoiensis TaxID=2014871 RepID=A0A402A9W2_9CHLR|nr:DinB family protein [Tengunoibacter tsumagoiensis]GCE15930.1 hypothetical protein KTT_57890 [Tengunoibacter tsumagoiensis]
MIDFSPIKDKKQSFAALAAGLTKADLYAATDEMVDTIEAIISEATDADVVFVPVDPNANDQFGIPEEKDLAWTLGHVIVHVTASSEESAALALTLARGLPVEGRSRYETPWESVKTIVQLRQRLAESRRMRKSLLDAWPDEPHLDVTYSPFPQAGELNAIARFILGLYHDADHLDQLREIVRQAKEARA